jgi:hypothetical protein
LIPRAANRDIVALFEYIFWTCISVGELAIIGRSVNNRKKYDVPFIALELRSVAAEQTMSGENVGRQSPPEMLLDE